MEEQTRKNRRKVETRGRNMKELQRPPKASPEEIAALPEEINEDAVAQAISDLKAAGVLVSIKEVMAIHKVNKVGVFYKPKKSDSPKVRKRKVAMLKALENSMGIVSVACRAIGLDKNVHYDWIKDDAEYRAYAADCKEKATDYVESKMFKLITNDNVRMIEFYLETQGKDRGYVRSTHVHNTKESVPVHIKREIIDAKPRTIQIPNE